MELNREQIRLLILYDFKSNLSANDCMQRLHMAFGNQCVSRATVFNWYREFKNERMSLNDDPRSGRPVTASGDEMVAAVRDLVEHD